MFNAHLSQIVEDYSGNSGILSFIDFQYSSSPEFSKLKWMFGEI